MPGPLVLAGQDLIGKYETELAGLPTATFNLHQVKDFGMASQDKIREGEALLEKGVLHFALRSERFPNHGRL